MAVWRMLPSTSVVLAIALCSGASSCRTRSDRYPEKTTPTPDRQDVSAREIVRLLKEMPSWFESIDDPSASGRVLRTMQVIASYSLDEIRAAITLFVAQESDPTRGPNMDNGARLLILNKYLFEIPDAPATSRPMMHGWLLATTTQPVTTAWPLYRAPDGELKLHVPPGAFSGPPYHPLDEFDSYRAQYPRRPTRGQAGRKGQQSFR